MVAAGELRDSFTFYSFSNVEGALGNERSDPVEEFTTRGRLIPQFGGEEFRAARLAKKQPYNLTVRQNSNTRRVTTDWVVKAVRSGELFNIRTKVDPTQGRVEFEMLVESGVAT